MKTAWPVVSPVFQMLATTGLEKFGIAEPEVRVSLCGDQIIVEGSSGSGQIAVAEIAQMRVGFVEGKSTDFFVTNLWLREGEILSLSPVISLANQSNYGAFARALAAQVATARGVEAIERGTTLGSALIAPVLLGLLFMAGLYSSLITESANATASRWIAAVVTGLPFAFILWRFCTTYRPAAIKQLSDLESQLPR